MCRLNRLTVLQPHPHKGMGCLPHHWVEVGKRQVECPVAELNLSARGESEEGPHTTGVSSKQHGDETGFGARERRLQAQQRQNKNMRNIFGSLRSPGLQQAPVHPCTRSVYMCSCRGGPRPQKTKWFLVVSPPIRGILIKSKKYVLENKLRMDCMHGCTCGVSGQTSNSEQSRRLKTVRTEGSQDATP